LIFGVVDFNNGHGHGVVMQLLASCLILEAIALERFIAVVCPLRHHTLSTMRSACVIILGCWGYAMVVGGMPLAGWNVVDVGGAAETPNATTSTNRTTSFDDCRFDTVVGASYVAFLYPGHFVPLCVIMLVVYVQVGDSTPVPIGMRVSLHFA